MSVVFIDFFENLEVKKKYGQKEFLKIGKIMLFRLFYKRHARFQIKLRYQYIEESSLTRLKCNYTIN